jgi:hypothetical protein
MEGLNHWVLLLSQLRLVNSAYSLQVPQSFSSEALIFATVG